jgi:hypothetical protein
MSGQKKAASAPQGVYPQQIVEKALHDPVRIVFALVNPIGIGDGKNRQARNMVTRPNSRFERIRAIVVAIIGQQVK